MSDASGTFYGSTFGGGAYGQGTVFALIPNADRSAWTYQVLRNFCPNSAECSAGANPVGRLVIDTQGNLYGSTTFGGRDANPGHGVVFKLTTDHKLAVLYRFCVESKCADGDKPEAGLAYAGQAAGAPYDGVSPLYGTTSLGGTHNKGTAFEITFSGGTATHKTIYDFCSSASCTDGWLPSSNLTIDGSGSIIGTASAGGAHETGVVYKLSPTGGGAWTETVLHAFCSEFACTDGRYPRSGLVIDGAGDLFGLADYGPNKFGVLYRLSGAQYTVLHAFCQQAKCADGSLPGGDMAMDASGALFGTTDGGGVNGKRRGGTVFRFGGGDYSVLYGFCTKRRCKDGSDPLQGVVLDAFGKLFGTTGDLGRNGQGGTVFELTP